MVPEGGSAKLVCKARGYPKPEIVWKREDGAEIISRAGLSGGKTKCEYNYTYYHIIIRSSSIFMLCDILILRIILNNLNNLRDYLIFFNEDYLEWKFVKFCLKVLRSSGKIILKNLFCWWYDQMKEKFQVLEISKTRNKR